MEWMEIVSKYNRMGGWVGGGVCGGVLVASNNYGSTELNRLLNIVLDVLHIHFIALNSIRMKEMQTFCYMLRVQSLIAVSVVSLSKDIP